MKIAMVVGNDLTRDNRVRREARALAAAGHRVTVYGVLAEGTEPEEDDGDVVIVRVPLPTWARTGGGVLEAWRLARWYRRLAPLARTAVARERPEAFHAHDLEAVLPVEQAAREIGVPLVYDDHEGSQLDKLPNYVPAHLPAAKRRVLHAAVRALMLRGERIERDVRRRGLAGLITVSEGLADDLVRRFGPPRATVVRNCPPFRVVARTDALRIRIGAYPTDRLLLYHGTATEGSGLEAAVRALRLLGEGHVLVVLGWAARQEHLERLAAAEGVAAQLRFLPGVPEDEMFAYVAAADVGIIPTEANTVGNRLGLPNKLFECLMAGLPVVASDVPEVGRILRATGAGVLYAARDPQDPAAIAEGVHTLLSDPHLHAACRSEALRAAREELNWERESVRLVDLYDRISSER